MWFPYSVPLPQIISLGISVNVINVIRTCIISIADFCVIGIAFANLENRSKNVKNVLLLIQKVYMNSNEL